MAKCLMECLYPIGEDFGLLDVMGQVDSGVREKRV